MSELISFAGHLTKELELTEEQMMNLLDVSSINDHSIHKVRVLPKYLVYKFALNLL